MDIQTERMVRKSVTVPLAAADAFELFTTGIATWWPVASHAIAEESEAVPFVEGGVGGTIGERTAAGSQPWGTISEWDPPRAFATTWHPGYDADLATQLRVAFVEIGPRATRVELDHRGWEIHGGAADERFAGYDTGWDTVLGRYVAQAG